MRQIDYPAYLDSLRARVQRDRAVEIAEAQIRRTLFSDDPSRQVAEWVVDALLAEFDLLPASSGQEGGER